MKKNTVNRAYLYLLSLGMIAGITGSLSPWLELPLSAPTLGVNSPFVMDGLTAPFSTGKIYISTILIATISIGLKWRIMSILSIISALFLLLYFPVYNIFLNSDWVGVFIQEDKVKRSLEGFIKAYNWPNSRPSPRFISEFEFEFLYDRVQIFIKMMSWGWFLAFVGLIILWLSSKIIYFNDRKVRLLEVSLFLLMIGILFFLMLDSVRANNFHKSGDKKLASGSLIEAVDLYNKSIKLDKTLQFSKPFLTKVSKALYLIHGNKYTWAQFYIAVQLEGNRNKNQKTVDRVSFNRNVRLLLDDALKSKPDTIFETSIYNLSRQLTIDSWVEEGHLAYSRGHVETALQAYLNATLTDRYDVRLFIAHTYKHLHKFNQSILINLELRQKIHNPFIKSMLSCSLGDTYQEAGNLNLARQAYFDCMDFDPISNYHAAKSLSGT